jgi:hypothetical protein
MEPFHVDSPQNYVSFLEEEENYMEIIFDTSFKDQFPRKSYIEFWVTIGEDFPHISRKVLNILLPTATSYLCETGFSDIAVIKQNIVLYSTSKTVISKLLLRYTKLCS